MSLFTELKRRNVFRMAVLYAVAGWLIMQVAEVVITLAVLPNWTGQALLALLAIGFPIALVFSWFYELTPEGISLEKDIEAHESITQITDLRMNLIVISLLCAAVLLFAFDKWWLRDSTVPVGYENSVAVLAFDDLSPEGDQGWFSDGLSEEIINSLAQLTELKVAARTSAFHFKGLDLPIPEIAATLGVAHVVEGSVRRAGDRMRVTAQLIKADDGFHLWSETYDRPTDDVFAVQEDIAANIASALDIYLDEERREEMFQIGTRNVQAYEAYLRGGQVYNEWHSGQTGDLIWEAQRWFERALEHDPKLANAHFLHGDAYFHYAEGHIELPPDADSDLTAEAAIELALLDYDRAIEFAHNGELRVLYQAERTFISDDWSGFRSLLNELGTVRETSTNPNLAMGQSYTAFALLGRAGVESNYRHYKRYLERSPLDSSLLYWVATSAMGLGKYDEALEFSKQLERIDAANKYYVRFLLQMQTGRYEESLNDAERPLALALAGRRDEARAQAAEDLQQEDNAVRCAGVSCNFFLTVALRELGEVEEAAKRFQIQDNSPVSSNVWLTLYVSDWGGRLVWDLEWTPNYAARLAELGVELEQYEFPPPAE